MGQDTFKARRPDEVEGPHRPTSALGFLKRVFRTKTDRRGEILAEVRDKTGKLRQLIDKRIGAIEIGCGPTRAVPSAVGIDAMDYPAVDVVGDVFDVLGLLPNGSIQLIHSAHFLEHVEDLERLMREIARVSALGAKIVTVVPHFSNPYFYSDPTHRRAFGLYSMSYYARCELFRRRVPQYGDVAHFELNDVKLGFRSPFRLRYAMRVPLGWLVNATRWGQEFYEEFLTNFIYCYEITFVLLKR